MRDKARGTCCTTSWRAAIIFTTHPGRAHPTMLHPPEQRILADLFRQGSVVQHCAILVLCGASCQHKAAGLSADQSNRGV